MATEQEILHELQDDMVKLAEGLVRQIEFPSKGDEATQKRKTQASRAIEVAQAAGSLGVFVNWLRYHARFAHFWIGFEKCGKLTA